MLGWNPWGCKAPATPTMHCFHPPTPDHPAPTSGWKEKGCASYQTSLSLQLRSSAASSQGLLPSRSSPVPPQLLGSRPCPHMYHFCLHLCPPSQHVPVEHHGDLTGRASQTPSIIQSTPSMLDSVLSPIEPSQLPRGWYCYLLIQQTRGQKLREGEPACGGLQD